MTKKSKGDGDYLSLRDLISNQNMQIANRSGSRESVSWGTLHLDAITNGVPKGLINQIAAEPGKGKTLMGIMTLMEVIKRNLNGDPIGHPLVIDSERRWHGSFVAKSFLLNGLPYAMPTNPSNPTERGLYTVVSGTTIEANWNLIISICENNIRIGDDPEHPDYVGYILWDSLGMSPNDASLMKRLGESNQPGAYAVINNNAARQAMLAVDDAGLYCIVINGLYSKIGVMFGSPLQRKGGNGIEGATSIGIMLQSPDATPTNMTSKKATDLTLDQTTGTAYKSFRGRTFKSVNGYTSGLPFEFPAMVQPGVYVDWYQEAAYFGAELGLITGRQGGKPSGNSIAFFADKELGKFGSGGATLAQHLRYENKELASYLYGAIKSHLKNLQDNLPVSNEVLSEENNV